MRRVTRSLRGSLRPVVHAPHHAGVGTTLFARLDARDRALFARWMIERATAERRVWITLTHLGGLWCSVGLAALPLLMPGVLHAVGARAAVALVVSHGIVQVLKRSVLRARPDAADGLHFTMPDAFSFPSGHATAAMAVAFVYASAFPAYALPLLTLAAAVGFSRVRLGVHYPGDVLVGQALAVLTDIVVLSLNAR
jgi:undecaprenyl-diphosphatase